MSIVQQAFSHKPNNLTNYNFDLMVPNEESGSLTFVDIKVCTRFHN